MPEHIERLARAAEWRAALGRALVTHGGADVVVPYSQVSCAFPSSQPNSRSFEVPLIDSAALKEWAGSNGWAVELTPEMEASDGYPPVRFTRRSET